MGMNSSKKGPISEINVTPLVDVMLVLLIIFMVTAPLMLNEIKLTLPRTQRTNATQLTSKQIVLSLTNSGELYVGKDKVLKKELIAELKSLMKTNRKDTVFLRADYGIKYGKVAKLMSHLNKSGIYKLALVTEVEK